MGEALSSMKSIGMFMSLNSWQVPISYMDFQVGKYLKKKGEGSGDRSS